MTQSIISGVRAVLPRRTSAPDSLPSLPIAGGWAVTQEEEEVGRKRGGDSSASCCKKQHLIGASPPSTPDHSDDRGQRRWP